MTQSVLTIGYSQSIMSTQPPEFQAILNQQVDAWMTYFVAETERLSTEMTELQ
jgi:hypothetical protein